MEGVLMRSRWRRSALIAVVVLAPTCATRGATWKETVLYSFTGIGANGIYPQAGVIFDAAGNLYGTTQCGGAKPCTNNLGGTVFELTHPARGEQVWTETVLHAFGGPAGGSNPWAGLTFDEAGNLYGTTYNGGSGSCEYGCGTVFRLAPPNAGKTAWKETVLHSFADGADGGYPRAGVILDAVGNLYTTASYGGGSACGLQPGCGTVLMLAPPVPGKNLWTETVLHSFAGGVDGAVPVAGLTFDASGDLYGTTVVGGSGVCEGTGCGTVFELSPPTVGKKAWKESVLYSFTGQPAGAYPYTSLIYDPAGNLYGTTNEGGTSNAGTVFQLSPPLGGSGAWKETVLYSFSGPANGVYPSSLVFDGNGNLYGAAAQSRGKSCKTAVVGCGMIFKLAPPGAGKMAWTETVLHYFADTGTSGEYPSGVIFDTVGNLFGTTEAGGASGYGTVFRLAP
jgi:uncharacterized repeat protein (TIGR03803 family)